jgi:DNA-binding MarR family transcriptional regulator
MAELDEQLVAPARLRLMTTLAAVSEAEFATVREALDVSDSVLSKHLGALEEVGYVRRHKGVHRGRRTTWISLTPRGRQALGAHVAALQALIGGLDPGALQAGAPSGPRT